MKEPFDLAGALDTLSSAKSSTELARAHGQVQRAVRRSRTKEVGGILAQSIGAALDNWSAQKADGVTFQERVADFEKTVRACWPKGREEPWHTCAGCSDYGLEMHVCPGDATCGRPKPHLAHDYGTPCWCPKGNRFRESKPNPEDFKAAGKAPKRSGFGGFGR